MKLIMILALVFPGCAFNVAWRGTLTYVEQKADTDGRVESKPVTLKWALANGWRMEDTPDKPLPKLPKRYSKLKIMRELSAIGLWDTVEQALTEAGAIKEFEYAQDIAEDDPMFQSMYPMLAGLAPEGTDIEGIMRKCETRSFGLF